MVLCNVGNDSVFSVVNLEVYISCLARVESSQLLLALLSSSKHTKSVGIVALVLAFSLGWFLFFPAHLPFSLLGLDYWIWIHVFTRSCELRSCAVGNSLVASSNGWDWETVLNPLTRLPLLIVLILPNAALVSFISVLTRMVQFHESFLKYSHRWLSSQLGESKSESVNACMQFAIMILRMRARALTIITY